jgi:hypothetical protein
MARKKAAKGSAGQRAKMVWIQAKTKKLRIKHPTWDNSRALKEAWARWATACT